MVTNRSGSGILDATYRNYRKKKKILKVRDGKWKQKDKNKNSYCAIVVTHIKDPM